ncbi:MAG: helix-turn-helix transcriptional regulator [Oscillospiraceae bacterium]|nr:helix-turn-helix transcriptional regulator [Oscillospiraceae bacterium]
MNKETLGKFISENRKALGMTQEELANKLFITNKAVSK